MLHCLKLFPLSVRHSYLKLITVFNIKQSHIFSIRHLRATATTLDPGLGTRLSHMQYGSTVYIGIAMGGPAL